MTVLGAVSFMAQLDFFIVNVALNGIGKSFPGSNGSTLSWVLNAYAVVFAAVLVAAGRFADRYGRKKVLLVGVAVFTVASAFAAVAPSLGFLILARAVQAVGAAMIVPASLGLLYPSFPKHQHTLVVGLWAGVAAVAAAAGPPVGGLLVAVDWRWIFLINLPIGVATIIGGWKWLPETREARGSRLPDIVSAVALLLAVALLILGIVEGHGWGWGSWRIVTIFAAAVVLAAVTIRRSWSAASPIIERDLFRNRQFTAATITLLAYFTGFSIFLLGGALFMQNVWHFSAIQTGLALTPTPLAGMGFATTAGPIQRRFGRTLPAVAGAILMVAAALYWLLAVGDQPAYATAMLPGLILMGISGGLSQAPMFAVAGTLSAHRAATGSAVLNMSRQVGSAIGVAVLIALTAAGAGRVGFEQAWWVQAGSGVLAAATLLTLRTRNHR
jgi:EmrB/QacA subfamily drug resistance transporter